MANKKQEMQQIAIAVATTKQFLESLFADARVCARARAICEGFEDEDKESWNQEDAGIRLKSFIDSLCKSQLGFDPKDPTASACLFREIIRKQFAQIDFGDVANAVYAGSYYGLPLKTSQQPDEF